MGFRVEVVPDSSHEGLCGLAKRRLGGVLHVSRRVVVGVHHADRCPADLPRELRAVEGVNDRARVHDGDRSGDSEDLGPLEKERTQLWEKQGESLIHFDLRLVGLDLREVGVERHVGNQVRRHAVLDVDTPLGRRVAQDVTGRRIERAESHRGERRQNLEVAAGRQPGHAFEDAHLREEASDVARNGRPDHGLVLALDASNDLKPPAVHHVAGPLRIAEALEGNRDFGREPVLNKPTGTGEQRIPGPVTARDATEAATTTSAAKASAAARADDRVALDAVAVDRENVGSLLVQERIEVNREVVVLKRPVAGGTIRTPDARIRVVRIKGKIEVGAVVGDVDL